MGLFSRISKQEYIGEISHIIERLNDMFDSEIIDNWVLGQSEKRLKVLSREYSEEYGVPKDWLLNASAMIKMFSGNLHDALIDSQSSLNESNDRANYLAHKIRGFIFLHKGNKELAAKEFELALKDIEELNKVSKHMVSQGLYEASDDEDYEAEELRHLLKQASL